MASWKYFLEILWAVVMILDVAPYMIYKKKDLGVEPFSFCCDSECNGTGKSGRCYFRYLEVFDDGVMFVGAMNYLFKFNVSGNQLLPMGNLSLPAKYENNRKCKIQGKLDIPECQNHVRVVMKNSASELFVCSTGAYSPTKYTINSQTLNEKTSNKEIGMCPYDPFDNATALRVESGNAGNKPVTYFGTYTDFNKNFPVFVRPRYTGTDGTVYAEKTTDIEESYWLKYPQFVGTFEVGNEIFMFFRETSIEYMDRSDKVYSRVAKVCTNDTIAGPMDSSKAKWLSFQKSRLVCSLPGASPYYFDDLYDVYHIKGEQYFFGLFYKQGADLNAAAICMYHKDTIKSSFSGSFKYKNSEGKWEKLPNSLNPNPRLDNCAQHDMNSSVFAGQTLKYLLMDTDVQPVFGRPIKYLHGVQLLRLVVSPEEDLARNIYAASSDGKVYQFFLKTDDDLIPKSFTMYDVAVYHPFDDIPSTPIWDMKLVNSGGVTSLILGTDEEVVKYRVDDCEKITAFSTCLLNMNCIVDCSRKCVHKSSAARSCEHSHTIVELNKPLLETLMAEDLINTSLQESRGIEGVYSTLSINANIGRYENTTWTKSGSPVLLNDNLKYALTSNNDLVIKNVSKVDAGNYQAFADTILVANYELTVADGDTNSVMEIWKQAFVDWSGSYNRWKSCVEEHQSACPRVP